MALRALSSGFMLHLYLQAGLYGDGDKITPDQVWHTVTCATYGSPHLGYEVRSAVKDKLEAVHAEMDSTETDERRSEIAKRQLDVVLSTVMGMTEERERKFFDSPSGRKADDLLEEISSLRSLYSFSD